MYTKRPALAEVCAL